MYRYVPWGVSAFTVGIALRSIIDFGWTLTFLLSGISVAVLITSRFSKAGIVIALMCVLCAGGVARMHIAIPTETLVPPEGELTFEGVVRTAPDAREGYTQIIFDSKSLPYDVLLRVDSFLDISYKDELRVTGEVKEVENFSGTGERLFNYRGYLAKDGVYGYMNFPNVEIVESHTTFIGALLDIKETYLSALKNTLPEPSAALAGGITVGERRSLGDALTEDFRHTGLIHIIVLSGYNIAIIILFISSLLSFFSTRARAVGAIISIIIFTLLVGASATVVRAALMGSIASFGVLTGRTYDALHALFVAGVVMLLWNPYLLVYDPSFQLSFIATYGLLVGVPLITPRLRFVPNVLSFRELVAATIATYVAVVPMLAYMVGEVSLVSLVVNIVVLPVIPFAMLMVFVTGLVGSVSITLATPLAATGHLLLSYVFFVVEFFAHIPFSVVSIPKLPLWVVGVSYLVVLSMVTYAQPRNVS